MAVTVVRPALIVEAMYHSTFELGVQMGCLYMSAACVGYDRGLMVLEGPFQGTQS
jgi:hypothetical protein